jgi:hypothetical protein
MLVRIDNDDKLREKVDEAMTVYDDYVKKSGVNPAEVNGEAAEEPTKEAESEAAPAS